MRTNQFYSNIINFLVETFLAEADDRSCGFFTVRLISSWSYVINVGKGKNPFPFERKNEFNLNCFLFVFSTDKRSDQYLLGDIISVSKMNGKYDRAAIICWWFIKKSWTLSIDGARPESLEKIKTRQQRLATQYDSSRRLAFAT